jgi:hypothetical protein
VKDYNVPGNTWTWNTTGLADNTYYVAAWARNVGSPYPVEVMTPATRFVVRTIVAPATSVTLSASPSGPSAPGTPVVWTATAAGGSGNYEYRFYLFNNTTGAWAVVKDYNVPGNTWTWTTTGLADNTYYVAAWARSVGSPYSVDVMSRATSFVVRTTVATATGLTLSASPSVPSAPGTPVVWTATASGGSGNYEYRFYLLNNTTGTWAVVKDYNVPGNTWTWTTGGLPPGNYKVAAWARSVGSPYPVDVMTPASVHVLQ